ncbi:hypothetical protein [Saccharibacillus alkalitolerans]|uniref:Uncharacterized protein n=1 Tax=Saccharibacillus alkalitolerans TaxID=2705290 RepID=A0ABX0F9S6_9BACL|nr:hypothetical protein [Saccharibacillus alkalitolerans]NGZ77692.1 hypothetical protein [Saccharibacillus alkalitolerans]
MKRKAVTSILIAIFALAGLYLYADRSVIALKTGMTLPLQWDNPYRKEEAIRLTQHNQGFSAPTVKITPLYYLPESKKLQFGLWYSKRKYHPALSPKIPDRIFQVSVRGKNGRIFDNDNVIETSGVFDEFQRRSIAIDLSDQDSIEITISLIEQDGTLITPIKSSSFNVQLK